MLTHHFYALSKPVIPVYDAQMAYMITKVLKIIYNASDEICYLRILNVCI